MTQNLRLGSSRQTVLTSSDSDVLTQFILPASSSNCFRGSTNSQPCIFVPSSCQECYHYNWSAATAGKGTDELLKQNITIEDSICPKKWDLPSKDDFDTFVGLYDFNTAQNEPANFKCGTTYNYNDSVLSSGWSGWYSSTSTSNWDSNYGRAVQLTMSYNSSYSFLTVDYNTPAGNGLSVRCIAQ